MKLFISGNAVFLAFPFFRLLPFLSAKICSSWPSCNQVSRKERKESERMKLFISIKAVFLAFPFFVFFRFFRPKSAAAGQAVIRLAEKNEKSPKE